MNTDLSSKLGKKNKTVIILLSKNISWNLHVSKIFSENIFFDIFFV